MGSGAYSSVARGVRLESADVDYRSASREEIFTRKNINNAMDPMNLTVRESRDSEEHPNSLAIIIALDVTGSMGTVPHSLVKEGLPHIMDSIIGQGIPDPQILFLGIGDHECDSSPLQVSQFESSDELLDKWLVDVYLEGGGGGNDGESYHLAWYTAGYHTSIDCMEKRNKKGYLFTIGDEHDLPGIDARKIKQIMGEGQYEDFTSDALLRKASEKYHVFHINIGETRSGQRPDVANRWKQLIGAENLIVAEKHKDVSTLISDRILEIEGSSIPEKVMAGSVTSPTEEIL